MRTANDITGNKYGRLTAIKPTNKKSNSGELFWLWMCDCGIMKLIRKSNVVTGRTKSCGCLVIERGLKRWGPGSLHWKGGKTINSQGYLLLYMPKHPNADKKRGYVREHVFVMSNKLGRKLEKGEQVHHKNGIKTDNRLKNLELRSGNHGSGQSIDDLVSDSIKILNKYHMFLTPNQKKELCVHLPI